jgi:hypothetical protein
MCSSIIKNEQELLILVDFRVYCRQNPAFQALILPLIAPVISGLLRQT